jgi:ubiquitin C-terminal hydrolase
MNIPFGLTNVGNTCWLNSILQCIINLDRSSPIFTPHIKKPLHQLLCQLTENSHSNSTTLLDRLVKHLDDIFSSGLQHDSSEAFLIIIDRLQKEEQSLKLNYKSIHTFNSKQSLSSWIKSQDNKLSHIYETFYSQIRYTLSDSTVRYESMSIFPLYIDHNFSDSFELLFMDKKITALSPIITIQIINSKNIKKMMIIDSFEINCDRKKTLYNFNSCIYHLGNQNGGHYISVVKIKKSFYICNDNTISRLVDNSFFINNVPLLMFYTSDKFISGSNS